MALNLYKLVIAAETTTNTDTNPNVKRYFYNLNENERQNGTITIPATSFIDDTGQAVTDALDTVAENNGYYLLYINGVLQQSNLYTVANDGTNVIITEASTVPVDAPIILVVNNFDPISTSTTTVTT